MAGLTRAQSCWHLAFPASFGDILMSFCHSTQKGSGIVSKEVDLEIAIRWLLKEGKIIEHHSFFDTASLLIQQTQLARPSSLPKKSRSAIRPGP
jgi:hypothetical protein